ncbi:MAG: hypothetical protein MZV64_19610 [Ignavibacteriales bacterium]|nr:hypothetical protein [Ignavibacteriales bacterium]
MIGDLEVSNQTVAGDHWGKHGLAQAGGLCEGLQSQFAPIQIACGVARGDQPLFENDRLSHAVQRDGGTVNIHDV